jgi:predicted phage terminase large subunit-like protein
MHERSGTVRWFVRKHDVIVWADSPEELAAQYPDVPPKSVTFIAASVHDNPILLQTDPGYVANLEVLPRHERERLLGGNWNARAAAGELLTRSDFEIVDASPRLQAEVRYWDRAATEPSDVNPDPDWTVGVKMGRTHDGRYVITDVDRFRARSLDVRRRIKNVGSQDAEAVKLYVEQDPGAAGKAEVDDLIRYLAGLPVAANPVTTRKYLRWRPFVAQAQAGNVLLLRGSWNDTFLAEMEALSENPKDYAHDDQADAAAGAFSKLAVASGKVSGGTERARPRTAGIRTGGW